MSASRHGQLTGVRVLSGLGLSLALLLGAACGAAPTGGRAVNEALVTGTELAHHPPERPSRYLGKFIYQQNCSGCHGQVGPMPPYNLDVPGKRLSTERIEMLDAQKAARMELRKAEPDPFYPPAQGPYEDLYDFRWFANGGEFSRYANGSKSPLSDYTYHQLFELLSHGEHGDANQKYDYKALLSDRERWAVVYYIANMGLDNGQADWQHAWDQQIGLRKTIYGTHCSICHGAVGRGDGPEGYKLVPKPMNFTYLDWSAGVKSGYPVTDEYLYEIIANGKIHPSSIEGTPGNPEPRWTGMPFWKDTLREEDMWGLVEYIRSLSYVQD